MQKFIINGGKKMFGTINISGSKNATLPILAASILSDKKIILSNVPMVKDVLTMAKLLSSMGSTINVLKKKKKIEIKNKKKLKTYASYKLLKTMRAGILVLGPLLARYKKAKVSLPGGCAIGSRPIDLHLSALQKMGASLNIKDGYIQASVPNGLVGATIKFPKISVGATENILIAACFAEGSTMMHNCACEPEVLDLSKFLTKMGCNINWIGKRCVKIVGVKKIKPTNHAVIFDRIEAGTYIIAAAITNGNVIIMNVNPKLMRNEIDTFVKMGIKILKKKNKLIVKPSYEINKINLKTEPYPGFPTDLQAQTMVLMCRANGLSTIKENIFENRFMHVSELNRMGANIRIKGNKALIRGNVEFDGAEIMATDLRASVSLVLAGLISNKKTIINRIYHLDRGYENLETKLSKCGVSVKRLEDGK